MESSLADPVSPLVDSPTAPRWRAVVEVLLIFLVFSLHGAWPVPDVNEPHYLSKARHYWDPNWCSNDFFVNTADAHQVFYWTFGWLTRCLPLDQVAWLGRFLTWGLLAWAWRRLSWAVLPRAWLAVLAAELFVMLNENAHMAGEWVIGGVEAKGFAYVLVLLGLEAIVRGRWNRAWLLLGGASCLHVIVGGWATVAAGLAWLTAGDDRPPIRAMLPGLFGGLVLAMPGLWFALSLTHGVDADTLHQANAIYIWQRLPHHLAADRFKEGFPSRHLMMWGLWLVLVTVAPADAGQRRFRWFVSAAMFLALIGYGLVWFAAWDQDSAGTLLRFYWFRTSDVFIPLGVAMVGLWFVDQMGQTRPVARRLWLAGLIAVAGYDLWTQGRHLPLSLIDSDVAFVVPRADKDLAYDDWLQTCRWIKEHTDPQDQFLTPRMAATLRWYADRAQVVNWKDIPQDAAGIVEWWKRILDVYTLAQENPPKWLDSLAWLSPARLNELAQKYHAQYTIVQLGPDIPRLTAKAVFGNNSYAVYRLPLAEK
ncbi:MAG TPA: DUF6798 domain-containing protein [Pirellulales bacterium]|nr:DUF6798 domain-containing protein [Pirellulales bacterium]